MSKTYEAMFIFSGSLKEDALEKVLERIRGDIAKVNGTIVSSQVLGSRTFARPMKKRESGQYVKMMVSLEPKDVEALAGRFRLNEDIFRVQIVCEDKVKADVIPAKS